MIKTDTEILFQDPASRMRLLRHSRVIEVDRETFTVEFGRDVIALGNDDELLIFFNDQGEFMQQVVRVLDVRFDASRLLVQIIPLGDAICAETRESFRVVTISADISVSLGDEEDCTVQDVTSTSLSVVARQHHPVGGSKQLCLSHQGNFYSGRVTVQSRRVVRPGHIRYGLSLVANEEGDLLDGLQQIHLIVESAQLKRS